MATLVDLTLLSEDEKKYSRCKEYISLIGESDKYIIGTIVDKTGYILSVPFIEKYNYEFLPLQNNYRLYYQGTHVKVWKHDEKWMISTFNNPEASNSHYMNPKEKCGHLFDKFGGMYFKDNVNHVENNTHHFILVTKSLTVTSKIQDLYNNECVIVYIGSTDINGLRYELKFDNKIFFYNSEGKFLSAEIVKKRIYYPTDITEQYAGHIYDPFKNSTSINKNLVEDFYGENIMVINSDGSITKCIHPSYDKRYESLGGTCLKKKVWDDFYTCKSCYKKEFNQKFNVGVPDEYALSFIETLSKTNDYNISLATFYSNHISLKKTLNSVNDKFLSVLMYYILSVPREKVIYIIEYYKEYFSFKKELSTFIKTKGNLVANKNYINLFNKDKIESEQEFIDNFVKINDKALRRISDIYIRARPERNQIGYNIVFNNNLENFIYREINIYKIHKTLKFIKDNN